MAWRVTMFHCGVIFGTKTQNLAFPSSLAKFCEFFIDVFFDRSRQCFQYSVGCKNKSSVLVAFSLLKLNVLLLLGVKFAN
jgi:hypothetical protein